MDYVYLVKDTTSDPRCIDYHDDSVFSSLDAAQEQANIIKQDVFVRGIYITKMEMNGENKKIIYKWFRD